MLRDLDAKVAAVAVDDFWCVLTSRNSSTPSPPLGASLSEHNRSKRLGSVLSASIPVDPSPVLSASTINSRTARCRSGNPVASFDHLVGYRRDIRCPRHCAGVREGPASAGSRGGPEPLSAAAPLAGSTF